MKDATQFHIRPARPEEAGLFYTPHPEEDKRLDNLAVYALVCLSHSGRSLSSEELTENRQRAHAASPLLM